MQQLFIHIEHKYLIWDRAMDMISAKGRYPVKQDVLIYSDNGGTLISHMGLASPMQL